MIIVSQDKKSTVENLNLGIRSKGEYNQNYTIYNTEIGEDLGEYATEERAKEVLQEIVSKYKTTLYNSKTNETVVNVPKVYEMPKE